MVRLVAKLHKHIEFDMFLMQQIFFDKAKNLIDSGAKGFEDSIYAQLDAGTYFIKLLFATESYFLKQPCQSIQLELAFKPLSEITIHQASSISQPDFINLVTNYSSEDGTKVVKQGAIKSYNLNDKTPIESYKSFVELYTQKFTFPRI